MKSVLCTPLLVPCGRLNNFRITELFFPTSYKLWFRLLKNSLHKSKIVSSIQKGSKLKTSLY